MSFDKAIKHNKERHQYPNRARRVDPSCRHGGNCSYCERNRTIAQLRQDQLEKLEAKQIQND